MKLVKWLGRHFANRSFSSLVQFDRRIEKTKGSRSHNLDRTFQRYRISCTQNKQWLLDISRSSVNAKGSSYSTQRQKWDRTVEKKMINRPRKGNGQTQT